VVVRCFVPAFVQEYYTTVVGVRVFVIVYLSLFKIRLITFFLCVNHGDIEKKVF
jgi:hypothetical protein